MHEPFGVCGVGGVEDDTTPIAYGLGSAVVNVGGGVEPDAGVTVFIVVPAEEAGAVGLGVFEAAEPVGESGRYFKSARFRAPTGSHRGRSSVATRNRTSVQPAAKDAFRAPPHPTRPRPTGFSV